jgi:outer membrane protein assembly factor BamA
VRKKSPLIRIIGGVGKDTLLAEQGGFGAGRIKWYDLSTEANVHSGNGKYRSRFSSDPEVNSYNRHSFRYNITAPLLSVAFNPDDGVFLGAGVLSTRHAFRKEPFHVRQLFTANYAVATGAYNFRYQLDVTELVPLPFRNAKKMDLRFIANMKAPNYTQNFFGFGNNTEFPNEGDKTISYYRARFNLVELGALVRTRPLKHFSLMTGPVFQHFWIDEDDEKNQNKFITDPSSGLNQETLFEPKTYLGWQLQAVVDNRNHRIMPSRGFYWNSFARWIDGVTDYAYSFKQAQTELAFYTSFNTNAKFVIAARVGGGINSGNFEFFQAQHLGLSENLRGYRKFRFAGKKMVYNNIDLRLRLGEIKGYILPATAGLVFFHDIGRVWMPDENSGRWHTGYGGGIWLAPAGRYVFAACYSYSKDGGLPFISLGFQF